MAYAAGTKVSVLEDCAATVVSHTWESGLFGPMEKIVCRFDLSADAAIYGHDEMIIPSHSVRPDGVVRISNGTSHVMVPVADWAAACVKAALRRGKDDVTPEIAARGAILGRAAQIKRWRREATAPDDAIDEERVMRAAIRVASILRYGHDAQALERLMAGCAPPRRRVGASEVVVPFWDIIAQVREAISEGQEDRRRYCRRAAETVWDIW